MIRLIINRISFIILMVFLAWAGPSWSYQTEYVDLQPVRQALETMEFEDNFWTEGSLVLRSRTELNYTARDQGLKVDAPHWTEGDEILAFDFASQRAVLEYRQTRADGSIRWRREDYVIPGDMMIVNLTGRRAVHIRGEQFKNERLGVSRRLPQLLLREVMENRDWVKGVETNLTANTSQTVVHYCPPKQPCMRIVIDDAQKRLVKVSSEIDYPSRGDTRIEWRYSDYQEFEGIGSIATKIEQYIGEDLYFRSQITDVRSGALSEEPFALPDDITPPQEVYPVPENPTDWETGIEEISPGIFHAENVRPGINAFFADMGDSVLVFDAPAGYPLIELIPPGQLVPGATSTSISNRLKDLIQDTIPDKPIRFVVISHHHSDHIGGIRAFMNDGGKLFLPLGNLPILERVASNPHALANDGVSPKQDYLAQEVKEAFEITGTKRKAIVLPINDAPHASAMLAVWFPEDGVLFTGDLFYPQPLDRFPSGDRLPIMKYLVQWLDDNNISPSAVLGSHGTGVGGREHLEKIRNSDSE